MSLFRLITSSRAANIAFLFQNAIYSTNSIQLNKFPSDSSTLLNVLFCCNRKFNKKCGKENWIERTWIEILKLTEFRFQNKYYRNSSIYVHVQFISIHCVSSTNLSASSDVYLVHLGCDAVLFIKIICVMLLVSVCYFSCGNLHKTVSISSSVSASIKIEFHLSTSTELSNCLLSLPISLPMHMKNMKRFLLQAVFEAWTANNSIEWQSFEMLLQQYSQWYFSKTEINWTLTWYARLVQSISIQYIEFLSIFSRWFRFRRPHNVLCLDTYRYA